MQLHTIQINDLTVPENRQRRELDPEELQKLASSISQNGLIHPLVIRKQGESLVLVAGERRLKAIVYCWNFGETVRCGETVFQEGELPCLFLGELDPLQAEEIELEENIRRVDLSWQDRAAAVARLATLRVKQARARGEEIPSMAEISKEVRGDTIQQIDDTRRDIIVSRFLSDPDVAAAKNANEAMKIAKRKEEAKRNVELAEQVGKTFSAAMHTLKNFNCLPWMLGVEAETFDVILTDPPYGINADEFGDSNGRTAGAHQYKDDYDNWTSLMDQISRSFFRIAKPQAHLYMFCDVDTFLEAKDYMSTAGWTAFRTPLIWHKPNGMRAPWPEHGPQRKYELILFAVKGKKPVTRLYPDVITCPSDENLGHQAQKPVGLFVDLLRRSVQPGDSVLDPFCGSGTIFPACHAMQCKATGIEIDPASYGLALKRLGELK